MRYHLSLKSYIQGKKIPEDIRNSRILFGSCHGNFHFMAQREVKVLARENHGRSSSWS